ncbi:hypothetical protein [Clostridium botulinum]|uniref:Uncharacterized protein n=1 Tax=Clostridium botulinum (strain Kyoto / Type A2) TaxID=536232 RepID=C1FPY0_CLOBJ|nr:hypothetical protein [Clostridium botulinum]ACO85665.1 hypothetical protein CLM_2297 [Clostridium botulinum A2 str. Kyoto]
MIKMVYVSSYRVRKQGKIKYSWVEPLSVGDALEGFFYIKMDVI